MTLYTDKKYVLRQKKKLVKQMCCSLLRSIPCKSNLNFDNLRVCVRSVDSFQFGVL
jgi:hypothetical protein